MKKIIIIVFGLVVLLLGGALVAPSFIDWKKYEPQIVSQIESSTGYKVRIEGDLSMSILPSPHVKISGLSVTNPDFDAQKPFLVLDEASVGVALMPLFEGNVMVNSIVLVKPEVIASVNAQGQSSWMTNTLAEKKKEAAALDNAADGAGSSTGSSVAENIALNEIVIRDGKLVYSAANADKPITLEKLNVTLRGDTLLGPYNVSGHAIYNDQKINLDLNSGRIDQLSESIPLKIIAVLPQLGTSLDYAGVVSYKDSAADLQGELEIKVDAPQKLATWAGASLPPHVQKPFMMKGILSYTPMQTALRNASFEYGGMKASGAITADNLKPANDQKIKLNANLAFANRLDLSLLMPAKNENAKAGFIPETISLPKDIDLTLDVKAPEMAFQNAVYKNLALNIASEGRDFKTQLGLVGPGNTVVDTNGMLKFAGRTKDANGAVVLSDPSWQTNYKLSSDEPQKLASALVKNPLSSALARALSYKVESEGDVKILPAKIEYEKGFVKLNESRANLSGSYALGGGGKPNVAVALEMFGLDIDEWQKRLFEKNEPVAQKSKGLDIGGIVKSIQLPVNLDFSANIQSVRFMGRDYTKLAARVAQQGEQLKISTFELTSNSNDKLSVNGAIADLKNLSGVDLNLSADIVDVEQTLSSFGYDVTRLPKNIGNGEMTASFNGTGERLSFTTNLKALRGSLEASGNLANVLATPEISDITVRLRHPSYVDVVRLYQPSFSGGVSIRKTLDLFASVSQKGKIYTLSNLDASIGPSNFKGQIIADVSGNKPNLTAALTMTEVPVDKLLGLESSKKSGQRSTGEVRWSRNALNTGWLHSFNADVKATAQSVSFGNWTLSKTGLNLSLKDGTLDVTQLDGDFAGGQVAVTGRMKSSGQERQPVAINGNILAQNINLETFVSAFSGSNLVDARGVVTVDSKLQTSGISPAALIFALNGDAKANGTDIIFNGFDLAQMSRALANPGSSVSENFGRILDASMRGGSTRFETLEGLFTIKEGVVNFDKMLLTGTDAVVDTKGNVNLPLWTVDLTSSVNLTEPADAPPLTASFKGPLSSPAQTFGQNAMNQFFRKQLEGALINPLLEDVDESGIVRNLLGIGGGSQPQRQPPQPEPQTQQIPPVQDDAASSPSSVIEAQPLQPQAQEETQAAPEPAPSEAPPQEQRREITPEEALFGIIQGVIEGQ